MSVWGTGTQYISSSFSRQREFMYFVTIFTPHHHSRLIIWRTLLPNPTPDLATEFPSPWIHYPSASLPRLFVYIKWYRNIYLLSIAYGFRPQLRSRLTLGGSTFPRKPWTFDRVDCINARATHTGILSSIQSTRPFDRASARIDCSSTNA